MIFKSSTFTQHLIIFSTFSIHPLFRLLQSTVTFSMRVSVVLSWVYMSSCQQQGQGRRGNCHEERPEAPGQIQLAADSYNEHPSTQLSQAGGTSEKRCLRKGKMLHVSEEQENKRAIHSPENTKVQEEGRGWGGAGARADQPVAHGGPRPSTWPHSSHRDSTQQQVEVLGGNHDLWGIHTGTGFLTANKEDPCWSSLWRTAACGKDPRGSRGKRKEEGVEDRSCYRLTQPPVPKSRRKEWSWTWEKAEEGLWVLSLTIHVHF